MTNPNSFISGVLGVFLLVVLVAYGPISCGFGGNANPSTPTPTTYTITATFGSNGSIAPSGSNTINQGASQSYTISPNSGYSIATLIVDGTAVPNSTTYIFTNDQADHTISATFSPVSTATYTITASVGGNGVIYPSGVTTVSQGASQAYTITPNSGYAISTLVVDGTAVANSTSRTFSNVQANHTISATFSLVPSGNIITSLVPARTSGVAPLSVFFDASATSDASVTNRPFHDLEYTWSFGDANSGTWGNGAQPNVSSKNSATGPMATHIFETPGTYTVTMSVFDGIHSASTSTNITVQNPDTVFTGTNTVCFSTSANYTGCPVGATHVQTSDFSFAINNYQSVNRRLLFRRGETFTGASSAVVVSNGPGIIGAYGTLTNTKPNVIGPGTSSIIQLARGSTGDWRIMDLAMSGKSTINGSNVGVDATGPFHQVTILRLDISGVHSGIAASHWALSPGDVSFDQWSVQDSTVSGIPRCNWSGHYDCNWRMYIVGTRWGIQGNYLDGQSEPDGYSGGSHVFRSEYLAKSVLNNNTFTGAGIFQHNIKLHAWDWAGGAGGNSKAGVYSEKVIFAENKIVGGVNPWTVSLGPQNEIIDERVRDIVFERNWITSGIGSQIGIENSASEVTFRNNIIDLSGSAYHTGLSISRRGVEPTPNNVHVYNNTIFSGSVGDYVGIVIGTTTNAILQNNLASAPLASGPVLFTDASLGLVQTNNLLNNSTATLFVSANPITPTNFGLKSTSPARNVGLASVPVFSDFFLTIRPQSSVIDIGAVEGP